jgi:cyclase
MPLTIGGGVRTVEDVRNLLLAGADKVSFNSAAVADPDVIARAADRFGSQCIVVRHRRQDRLPGEMGDLHPWRAQTHRHRRRGIREDRDRKGRGRDPADLDGPRRHARRASTCPSPARSPTRSVPVIASGGVGTLDHLVEGVTEGGASAVLAASIFHFGEYTIAEAKAHMAAAGIPVRLS